MFEILRKPKNAMRKMALKVKGEIRESQAEIRAFNVSIDMMFLVVIARGRFILMALMNKRTWG